MRATLLNGNKILYGFDFLHNKLLNRRMAKSKKVLEKTFQKLKKDENITSL